MLTKNLILYKISGNKIQPSFVDAGDAALLSTAEELLAVFKSAEGQTRTELAEASKPIIDAAPFSAIIARGLEKLLLDRTEFDTAIDEKRIDFRQKLFAQTGALLQNRPDADYEKYCREIEQQFQQPAETLAADLYADLPEFQRVIKFKPFSPERLLHRYNVAQVQALLLRCSELEIRLGDSDAASLRQLFKYLRFRQLLATIRKDDSGDFLITVDGPLSLFYKTQKYGMNLALFFPAVLHQPKWRVAAQIRFKNRGEHTLTIDENSGLQPYAHQFLAYVPEEIQFFQDLFLKKVKAWQIEPAGNFVPLAGEFYCFPDFLLTHHSRQKIALELFHPWHASHLTARLQQLENAEKPLLILGVAKALLKDPLVAGAVESSPYFARFGFVFREMPTINKLTPLLETLLKT